MEVLFWTLLAFASGSLMFSYWLGLAVLRRDIRTVGDGNPGASNLLRAGGKGWGMIGLLLDYVKGVVPVLAAHSAANIEGSALIPVALAPVLGHAFSPWLRGHGGKAVAVTFGVWTGVSLWEGPVVLGALLSFWYALSARDGWTIFVSMLCFACYLAMRGIEGWLGIGLGCWAILAAKHYSELRQGWAWRPWLARLLRRYQILVKNYLAMKNIELFLALAAMVLAVSLVVVLRDNQKRPTEAEQLVIHYTQAREHVGQTVVVWGTVRNVFNNRLAVYLGFTEPRRGSFFVRILKEDWVNFPQLPEDIYQPGQTIRVRGTIVWYQGDPIIYVRHPSQIEIVKGASK